MKIRDKKDARQELIDRQSPVMKKCVYGTLKRSDGYIYIYVSRFQKGRTNLKSTGGHGVQPLPLSLSEIYVMF